ncbi:MAG: hypothetical protein HUU16_11805 [Candidatus Omnitrophica bacterium]|nr:hypothetical protein [bacterium]NUN96848.1 hypothetical protein [Candidatus Omnitrophota bacterium]
MFHIRTRGLLLDPSPGGSFAEDEEHMRLINRLAASPLERDQVYIRSMYLCSSQVCETDWRRFSDRALEQIRDKVVGESVLAGHDKRSLPVARFFKARIVERPEVPDPETGAPTRWVRAWFYWLKETQGARDLALNMDGGIYREVSISWRYRGGRCSLCGRAPRSCAHVPGEVLDGARCFIWIDEVVDVLEGSLVYRGADRETGIAGERHHGVSESGVDLERLLLFEAPLLVGEEARP